MNLMSGDIVDTSGISRLSIATTSFGLSSVKGDRPLTILTALPDDQIQLKKQASGFTPLQGTLPALALIAGTSSRGFSEALRAPEGKQQAQQLDDECLVRPALHA